MNLATRFNEGRRLAVLAAVLFSFSAVAEDKPADPARKGPVAQSIGPGSAVKLADDQDTPGEDRLNVDRTSFRRLPAGTFNVKGWKLNVLDHTEGGTIRPMVLTGSPPSYKVLWMGKPFDPSSNGIQSVAASGKFALSSAAKVYAGFFTAGSGSGIIAFDKENEGPADGQTDHANEFKAPSAPGQVVKTFSHPDLDRTYAFEVIVTGPPGTSPAVVAKKTSAKPAVPKPKPVPSGKKPVVTKKTPSKPAKPARSSPFPASFQTPSKTVKPSLSATSTYEARRKHDEDELEFRYWRNIARGKALRAALVGVDAKSGHMHLYLPGGKNYVLAIADYHDEDKAYILEWQAWKAAVEKRRRAKK